MLHDICKDSNSTYSGTRLNKETKQTSQKFLPYQESISLNLTSLLSILPLINIKACICALTTNLSFTLPSVWSRGQTVWTLKMHSLRSMRAFSCRCSGWCPRLGQWLMPHYWRSLFQYGGNSFFGKVSLVYILKQFHSLGCLKSSLTLKLRPVFIKKLDANSIIWWWQGESSNCMFVFWPHSISNMKRWED